MFLPCGNWQKDAFFKNDVKLASNRMYFQSVISSDTGILTLTQNLGTATPLIRGPMLPTIKMLLD